jgi:hypothetical protein
MTFLAAKHDIDNLGQHFSQGEAMVMTTVLLWLEILG